MTPELAAIFARPVAHRGLHDRNQGRIENSPAAFALAIDHGYAIECDIQLSADGQPIVFHDDRLDRLTASSGNLRDFSAAQLGKLQLSGSSDQIPSLAALLALVNGQVPLVIELKPQAAGATELADAVVAVCRTYDGPVALKSFDPGLVRRLRSLKAPYPLGIVSEIHTAEEYPDLSAWQRWCRTWMLHGLKTRYDFISYDQGALPHPAATLARRLFRRPVMSWTVSMKSVRRRPVHPSGVFQRRSPERSIDRVCRYSQQLLRTVIC